MLKISLILWDKFICNFKYIFINETGFIKKNCKFVIVVGKLTRSRVLWDRAGLRETPKGEDGARKFSPSCGAGQGWGKTKPCLGGGGEGGKDPILWIRPAPFPFLTEIKKRGLFFGKYKEKNFMTHQNLL